MAAKTLAPIRIKPIPRGFDQYNPKHMLKLTTMVQEDAAKDPTWDKYELLRIDDKTHNAIYKLATLSTGDGVPHEYMSVNPGDVNEPSKQRRMVRDRYEPEYPGFVVTDFDTSDTTKTIVTLSALDEKAQSARRIFANVFKVDPWHIGLSRTSDHGWKIMLKPSANKVWTSQYASAMQEAVEQVGRPGWFYKADPETGIVMVHPGVPPTFPKAIKVPAELWGKKDIRRSWFGMKLPDKGRETGDVLCNDWKEAPGVLVSGQSGGGKSVIINSLIYGHLAAGGDIAIVDDADKSIDFTWCRPWVMDNGWGCDGIESCAATLQHVYDLCRPRAQVIKQYGKENWWNLPDDVKRDYPPLLLVCDEISQWAVPPKIPTGLEKDNPTLIRAKYENSIIQQNFMLLLKISQKARFAGIRFLYAAQSATAQAGLDPKCRINLASKILVGEKTSDTVRDQVLSDSHNAPKVPLNVVSAGRGKGTGVAELAGQDACVYKGFYEETPDKGYSAILRDHLTRVRPPAGDDMSGHMSWREVCRLVPMALEKPDDGSQFDGEGDGDESRSRLDVEGGFGVDGRDVAENDPPLRGAAAAAHASRLTGLEELQRIAALSAQKGM